jgi:lysyl endopeptidase
MKTIILGLCLSFVVGIAVQAQVNNGGLPLSITNTAAMGSNEFFTKTVYQAPDISVLLLEDAKATRSNPKPYRVGKLIPVDISFPQSGQLITLPNGTRVWRAQVQVAQAPALMFYYSQFKLPSGVKLFLSNGNGKQILGAYTQDNNSDDGLFVTQEIQGDIANIELNIDNGVDINAIKLHIDNAAYLYRSFEYLQKYASSEWNDA